MGIFFPEKEGVTQEILFFRSLNGAFKPRKKALFSLLKCVWAAHARVLNSTSSTDTDNLTCETVHDNFTCENYRFLKTVLK